jgi:hypothetical protein
MTAVLHAPRLTFVLLLTLLGVAMVPVDAAWGHAPLRSSITEVPARAGVEAPPPALRAPLAIPGLARHQRAPLGAGALAVVGATALGLITLRPRRAAIVLALGLVCSAFEVGLHSVHHLGDVGDVRKTGECAVASASSHAPGALDESVVLPEPLVPLPGLAPVGRIDAPRSTSRQPHDSRGPPSLLA